MPATKTRRKPIKNKVFGLEQAQKKAAEQRPEALMRRVAQQFASFVANSNSGTLWFDIDDLAKYGIYAIKREPLCPDHSKVAYAGALLDQMYRLIKHACFERGDYWYDIAMEDGAWAIGVYRIKPKRK